MTSPRGIPAELSETYETMADALLWAKLFGKAARQGLDLSQETLVVSRTVQVTTAQVHYLRCEVALTQAAGDRPSAFAEAMDWIASVDYFAKEFPALVAELPDLDICELLGRMRCQVIAAALPGVFPATTNSNTVNLDDPAFVSTVPPLLSAADLANQLGQPIPRVESFLRRFREDSPDCAIEIDNPRPREPRYLYRTKEVWPALQQQLPAWRTLTDE
jgi:hypothetical protein